MIKKKNRSKGTDLVGLLAPIFNYKCVKIYFFLLYTAF